MTESKPTPQGDKQPCPKCSTDHMKTYHWRGCPADTKKAADR